MIALSWLEVAFVPAVAVALVVGVVIGVRLAMADQHYVIYWRRRAKSAEGELRAMKKKGGQ